MKYNYFDALVSLSECLLETVEYACSDILETPQKRKTDRRKAFETILLELDRSLFEEFLPPLKRQDVADLAHAIEKVINSALEYEQTKRRIFTIPSQNEEETVCIEMARIIKESISILKHLKKTDGTPNIQEFRELLKKGSDARASFLSRASRSSLSALSPVAISALGNLRAELSHCFDVLLSVMLNNI